jgi:ATP-dependent HslUV protease ATP-binding subunit HslU
LVREDFIKILRDPENSLIKQYQALLKTEAVDVVFTEDALDTLADFAVAMNAQGENIGARRLQTIMEMLMDDLSFTAEAHQDHEVVIDRAYVEKYVQMGEQSRDADWIL